MFESKSNGNDWWKLTKYLNSRAGQKKLLIVEDQFHTRLLLKTLLTEEKYSLEFAEDSITALYLAEKSIPDLILLDLILMDNVDGLSLCKQLRSRPALNHTLIYVLSGYNDTKTKFDVLLAGANDFIEKPFSPIELLEKISRVRQTNGN